MEFKRALQYLNEAQSFEKIFGFKYDRHNFNLDRFRDFMREMHVPYQKLKYVHVAGSKGKGTVCRMVSGYLQKSGYKVGLFTSPHLYSVTERISISGRNISRRKFGFYIGEIRDFIQKDQKKWRLTYFEILTAAALKYFCDEKVSFAVLEVGLGGRLDSTNIVLPKVCALTRMELEHKGILGNTIAEILDEKLGIRKRNVPFVIGLQNKKVVSLIRKKHFSEVKFAADLWQNDVEIGFLKGASIENAILAFLVLKILLRSVSFERFKKFLRNFKSPGHFEVRQISGKTVVFDVAHTENSISNLLGLVLGKFPKKKIVFLISLMEGKNALEIGDLIRPVASKVFFTCANDERGILADKLAEIFKINRNFEIDNVPEKAFRSAFKDLKKDQVLVVTGSHFLLNKVRPKI